MDSSIILLIFFVATFLLSYFITKAMISVAHKIGLVCRPNHRSSHSELMPHGGGLGFVVPMLVVVTTFLFLDYLSIDLWLVIFGCGSLIVAVGLWDDIFDSSVLFRLLIQVVCVGLGVWLIVRAYSHQSNSVVSDVGMIGYILSAFILIWWLNLFNFMDGIDGLAGTEALFVSLSAILMLWLRNWVSPLEMQQEIHTIELLLAFLSISVLGFVVHNWAPARVFMGDAGSTFLGFTLGMIALSSIVSGALPISIWLILGAVFWVDATFTLLRRIITGKRWYLAHKSHAYQHATTVVNNIDKAYRNGLIKILFFAEERHTHKRVCLLILAINIIWLMPLASMAIILPKLEYLMVLLAWAPLVWVVYSLGAGKEEFK